VAVIPITATPMPTSVKIASLDQDAGAGLEFKGRLLAVWAGAAPAVPRTDTRSRRSRLRSDIAQILLETSISLGVQWVAIAQGL
tara:strand:- start:29326 stop:29577 length:252 start_codon:yes stop_codon:yes gene_type:complete